MKLLAIAVLTSLALSGCATYPYGKDDLCREMAAFANSVEPGTSHSVSLETAWGSSKIHPDAIASRDCHDSRYEPGQKLCRYLMVHTSREFPENNFHRALACLRGVQEQDGNFVSYERLDVRISGYEAYGVLGIVKVTVDFKPNADNGTEQLDISAEASKPLR